MGRRTFASKRKYFYRADTQKIQDEEGLHNSQARLRNKSGFLKYNYSLIGNTIQ